MASKLGKARTAFDTAMLRYVNQLMNRVAPDDEPVQHALDALIAAARAEGRREADEAAIERLKKEARNTASRTEARALYRISRKMREDIDAKVSS